MKRRLLIAAVFLLAGAVVNVVVAWGCAAWMPVDMVLRPPSDDFGLLLERIPTFAPDEPWIPIDPQHGMELKGVGILNTNRWAWTEKARDRHALTNSTNTNGMSVVSARAGLPMRSLQGVRARGFGMVWRDGALSLPRWAKTRVGFVPLRPIWPGFAVNTLLYATVLWLLIPGPFALRRFVRVKRGLCPACAYPMAESDVCSECGKSLAARASATT